VEVILVKKGRILTAFALLTIILVLALNSVSIWYLYKQINFIGKQEIVYTKSTIYSATIGKDNVNLPILADQVKKSVVAIWVLKKQGYYQKYEVGVGSGFITTINGRKVIITNYHVISDTATVVIEFYDHRIDTAAVLGVDERTDLAVLTSEMIDLYPSLPLQTEDVEPGSFVFAVGHPLGLRNSISFGIVSGIHRSVRNGTDILFNMIQTDAAINHGNSGGPLVGLDGKVVGVVSRKYNFGSDVNMVLPASLTATIADRILTDGKVTWREIKGIKVDENNPIYALQEGYKSPNGIVVVSSNNSLIPKGAIIIAIDRNKINNLSDYYMSMLRGTHNTAEVQYWYKGQTKTVKVNLIER
jgi:serine protease Do